MCLLFQKKETPVDAVQQLVDQAVLATRTGVETKIGSPVPTLNVFIQTPGGSWFSSSAGQGYQPITADTWFRFASNTKSFTAASALKMMQDEWLDLEATISDTIPGAIIERIYSFHAGAPKTLTDYLYDHVHGPTTYV